MIPPIFKNNGLDPRNLKVIAVCSVCGSQYNFSDIKVLEENANAFLTHLRCRKCGVALLSVVRISPNGLLATGMLTDLNSKEAMKIETGEAVSADEILEAYEILENNELIDKLK